MRPPGQWIGGALALIAFVLALWPRHYLEPRGDLPSFTLVMWPKLLRSVLFWVGLLFIALVLVQAFNPAWSFVMTSRGWTVRPENAIAWLPQGVAETPFAMMNPWRMLLIYGSAWLLACSLWVGITRARSVRILLTMLVVNGLLLCVLAFVQRAVGATKIFGIFPVHQNAWSFLAAFIYKNHAGAYFNLVTAAALALAFHYAVRARQRLLKSSPALLFLLLALVSSVTVFISYSRMAFGLWAVLMVFAGIVYLVLARRKVLGLSPASAALGVVCLLSAVLWFKAGIVRFDFATASIQRLADARNESSVSSRLVAYAATWEMAQDNLWLGHGAGSFRFIFPQYQIRRPELLDKQGRMAGLWEHTHNDYLEFLAEFGLLGAGLALALLAAFAVALRRAAAWRRSPTLILLAALLLLMVHAAADFPLQNPAIVCTALILAIACLKWNIPPQPPALARR